MPRRSAVQPWVVFTGNSGSVEQTRLGRRPASFRRGAFLIEVGEDLLDHHRIVDAGDDPHRPAAFTAGLDVDIEHPLETLRPAHRCPSLGRGLLLARLGGHPGMQREPGHLAHPVIERLIASRQRLQGEYRRCVATPITLIVLMSDLRAFRALPKIGSSDGCGS